MWHGCWSISETADLLGFSRTIISRVYKERFEKEKNTQLVAVLLEKMPCQRRMARPVQTDRKANVTQITTRNNQGL